VIARRAFLASAGCAVLAPMSQAIRGDRTGPVIWPVNRDLLAEESASGFGRAVPGSKLHRTHLELSASGSRCCIVPACQNLTHLSCKQLRSHCEAGGLVLLEGAFSFVQDPGCRTKQESLLRRYFGISITEPRSSDAGTKYVSLDWPLPVRVRAFGTPLSVTGGLAIGRYGPASAAQSLTFGRGQLIFLSFPLGPQLLAGDMQAHAWLHALLRTERNLHGGNAL
jgi:hypothetical protein